MLPFHTGHRKRKMETAVVLVPEVYKLLPQRITWREERFLDVPLREQVRTQVLLAGQHVLLH